MGEPADLPDTVDLGGGEQLRLFTAADVASVAATFAEPDAATFNPGPPDGDVEAFCRRRNDRSAGRHASWAVGGPGGVLLGWVSVFDIDPDQRDAEVGYVVVPAARGRGVARRALAAATAVVVDGLGVRRVQLYHAVDNPASCRVALAAGFAHEGTLRRSHRYGDGVWHDEHLHARLAGDPPA